MVSVPEDVRQKLQKHGQEHVLAGWERLGEDERRGLLGQLRAIDLEQIERLRRQGEQAFSLPAAERIAPIPVVRIPPVLTVDRVGSRQAGRNQLGVSSHEFVFLFLFDFHSHVQRKNLPSAGWSRLRGRCRRKRRGNQTYAAAGRETFKPA